MKIFLPLSLLVLLSSLGFARPAVKVSLDTEIRRVDNMLADLQRHQENGWTIGINGETLRPDHFARFFADRDLELKFFVQAEGLSVGDVSAYDANRTVLVDYRHRIVQEEMDMLQQIREDLEVYKQEVSSPDFTGELPAVDKYLIYFSEQRLPIQFEAVKGAISLASDTIYEKNMTTLNTYLSNLQKLQASSPAPVQ